MAAPKSLNVAYGCFGPTDCPRTARRPASSIEPPAVPRERIEECSVFLFISVLSPEESRQCVFHSGHRFMFVTEGLRFVRFLGAGRCVGFQVAKYKLNSGENHLGHLRSAKQQRRVT